MRRQPVEHFYSEKGLQERVDLINAFAGECSPWKLTQARKEHEDMFGEVIKPGENYFKHEKGPAFGDVLKLSALSMERLCFALFESTIFLKPIGDQILEQRRKRMIEAMGKLSIFGTRNDENKGP